MNRARATTRGFTLLELLVAMTLLALLAGLLFGGLSFGVRVWEKGDAELEKLAELQIAQGLIRRVISRALLSDLPRGENEDAAIFEGTADGLLFVGPAPAQSLPGGFYRLSLRGDDVEGKRRLVMTWRLPVPDDKGPRADEDENLVVLVDGVADVTFAYFGAGDEDGEPGWRDRWEGVLGLPRLVRIDVTFRDGDARVWPKLIAAPMVAATGF
jgi:general secretion pathway protein J